MEWIALGVGIANAVVLVFLSRSQRSKNTAEAHKTLAESESVTVGTLQTVLKELREERDRLKTLIDRQDNETARLHNRITELKSLIIDLHRVLIAFGESLLEAGHDPKAIIASLDNGLQGWPPNLDLLEGLT